MSHNPVNLGFRFVLEVVALVAIGYWGWSLSVGPLRYLLALGFPLLAAAAWGVFRVPGDTSASGKAILPVPGILRLILELAFFALAAWGLAQTGWSTLAMILAAAVALHYALSFDRITWLLRH